MLKIYLGQNYMVVLFFFYFSVKNQGSNLKTELTLQWSFCPIGCWRVQEMSPKLQNVEQKIVNQLLKTHLQY